MMKSSPQFIHLDLPSTPDVPHMIFIAPSSPPPTQANNANNANSPNSPNNPTNNPKRPVLLILPGGGYQKVMTEKEGTLIAEFFARECGVTSFVVDYRLDPRQRFLGVGSRARSVEVPLKDAVSALDFVRVKCSTGGPEFGDLDAGKICVVGFSAGGHLGMCLCQEDHRRNNQMQENETAQSLKTTPPKIAAALLVYPTLRSPTCWCITGGLWILPSNIGLSWPNTNQHKFCFSSNVHAMAALVPTLPAQILTVTVPGDLLLPPLKHSVLLCRSVRNFRKCGKGGGVVHVHCGPFWLPHGCGLHEDWGSKARVWMKGIFAIPDTDELNTEEGNNGDRI